MEVLAVVCERFAPDGQGGEVRAPGVSVTFSVQPPPPPPVVLPALPPTPAHPRSGFSTNAAKEREAHRDLQEMTKWCKRLVRLIAQRAEGLGDPNAAWRPFERVMATNADGLASIFVEPHSVVDMKARATRGEYPRSLKGHTHVGASVPLRFCSSLLSFSRSARDGRNRS